MATSESIKTAQAKTAIEHKSDICSALGLDCEEERAEVYVTTSSEGSVSAWYTVKTFTHRDIEKLATAGWEVSLAWVKKGQVNMLLGLKESA
jgi:hypothetical protein